MALLLILGFLLGGVLFLWLAQVVALAIVHDKNIWAPPFRHENESALVRWVMKGAVQAVLASILFGLPLAMGLDPIQYHMRWLLNPPMRPALITLALSIGILGCYQVINVLVGWMQVTAKYSFSKTLKKVLRSFLVPLPLAVVEEAVFRGVILGQLLDAFPQNSAGVALAVLVSAAIFSSVHFIRPLKKTILPAIGLFALGIALGIAFILAGRNCWLPIAIHAAGVWVIQVLRPFVVYRGPAWLIGYPSYPICGVLGILCMTILSVILLATNLVV
jgi:hypothetical protein